MNLSLLDPQHISHVPDRIDSTFHFPPLKTPSSDQSLSVSENGTSSAQERTTRRRLRSPPVATCVEFNRRGTYLAVGYSDGTVAVHDFASRTISAHFYGTVARVRRKKRSREFSSSPSSADDDDSNDESSSSSSSSSENDDDDEEEDEDDLPPVSSVVWSRDGRKIISGNAFPPAVLRWTNLASGPGVSQYDIVRSGCVPLADPTDPDANPAFQRGDAFLPQDADAGVLTCAMHPSFNGISVAVTHLMEATKGEGEVESTADGHKGKLYLVWWLPADRTEAKDNGENLSSPGYLNLQHHTTIDARSCSFDSSGKYVIAGTACGYLLIFDISDFLSWYENVVRGTCTEIYTSPSSQCVRTLSLPKSPSCIGLSISQKGGFILANCSDLSLHLYSEDAVLSAFDNDDDNSPSPLHTFSDMMSKSPWITSARFSGDGEHVAAARIDPRDHRYELHLWVASTGQLVDRLPGPSTNATSLCWHPARSFLAVSTNDGLVDMWGPRMGWRAFAPAFQALEMNVVYVEREDEFDEVEDDGEDEETKAKEMQQAKEKFAKVESKIVDVVTVDKVLAFASDDEKEEDVFYLPTVVRAGSLSSIGGRGKASVRTSGASVLGLGLKKQSNKKKKKRKHTKPSNDKKRTSGSLIRS